MPDPLNTSILDLAMWEVIPLRAVVTPDLDVLALDLCYPHRYSPATFAA